MKLNLIEGALNFIFPPTCGFCNEICNSYLCGYCSNYLKSIIKTRIDYYQDKFFEMHLWLFEYKDEIREKIISYKFNDCSYLYRTFAQIILSNQKTYEYIKSFDIIIPIPIHKKRKKSRGYNQSELIARSIIKEIETIELRTDLIEKVRNIKQQSSLSKEERLENVINAYGLTKNIDLKDKKILIFDDVYTTGSTVNECAKILSSLNCKTIRSNYFSKGLKNK